MDDDGEDVEFETYAALMQAIAVADHDATGNITSNAEIDALLAAGATFGWPASQTDPALLNVDTWACTDDVKDFPGPAGLPVEDTYSTDHYKNYDDGGTGLGAADPAAAAGAYLRNLFSLIIRGRLNVFGVRLNQTDALFFDPKTT